MTHEEWRDIVGYEGYYQVSNLGRIKSLGRKCIVKGGRTFARKSKILSMTRKDCVRRSQVTLVVDGKRVVKNVDELVCDAFMPNDNGKQAIYHINGKLNDCNLSNLMWVDETDLRRIHEEESKSSDQSDYWRAVVGYEGFYEVSRDGRVRSLDRIGRNGSIIRGKELIPTVGKLGYKVIDLNKQGDRKTHYIHRLIAEAFIPNPDGYNQIDHINGIKSDSRVDNLRWCNKSQNYAYAVELGMIDLEQKTACLQSKEVRAKQRAATIRPIIRSDGVVFDSLVDAAKDLGCTKNSIWRVLNGVRKSIHGYTFKYI